LTALREEDIVACPAYIPAPSYVSAIFVKMNNSAFAVRKHAVPRDDPRVERTKRALGSALVALMLERPFDDIIVQDVLDRAGIGRATFYAHFRNKRDLFLSDYERTLEFMEAQLYYTHDNSRRVAPIAEFFAHVEDAGPLIRAMRANGQIALMWELGAAHFARMIEKRLAFLGHHPNGNALSRTIASKFLAGAAIELLRWWLDRDVRPTPRQMDEMFHHMLWKSVG
jgi:AcrR family transcriptional regulator